MFSKGFWVHKNSIDVIYEVLAVYNVHDDYVKVKYRCWGKSYDGTPQILRFEPLKAKVMKKYKKDWSRYEANIN